MKVFVEIALKSMQHVVHIRKSSLFQYNARINGALAAATDQHDRTCSDACDQRLHMLRKLGLHVPVRRFLPRNVFGTYGMSDVKVFDFGADIDEHCISVLVDEGVGVFGGEVFHDLVAITGKVRCKRDIKAPTIASKLRSARTNGAKVKDIGNHQSLPSPDTACNAAGTATYMNNK